MFVDAGISEVFRERLLPAADIATPNRFELAHLSGRPVDSLSAACAAAAAVRALGPRLVVATGLTIADEPSRVGVLADAADGSWLISTPRLPGPVHGAGDAFSALLLGHYLLARDLPLALERAVAAIFALVTRTQAGEADELRLVAAQDEFAPPQPGFRAERLA